MERLASETGKDVWLGAFSAVDLVVSPFSDEEFALMLVHFDGPVRDSEKMLLARRLVAQRCRYAVCAGRDSGAWEDAFDEADIESNPDCDEDRFVMTTSHGPEVLNEVVRFFIWSTSTPHFQPLRFLVVAVGGSAADVISLRSNIVQVIADAAQPGVEPDKARMSH
jgi:hypothetical protein